SVSMVWFGQGMVQKTDDLKYAMSPGCPFNLASCDWKVGERSIAYDGYGNFDFFTVTAKGQINASLAFVSHNPATLNFTYFQASPLTAVNLNTYYLDRNTNKLMHSDGFSATDDVIADDVTDLKFDYFGVAAPPLILTEPTQAVGAPTWTGIAGGNLVTYGITPPPAGWVGPACFGQANTGPNCTNTTSAFYWPAGENCMFQMAGGNKHTARTGLNQLNGVGELAPLNDSVSNPGIFNDGPWCPDPNAANRWDADLLRIRKVRVTLRMQAALAALRG